MNCCDVIAIAYETFDGFENVEMSKSSHERLNVLLLSIRLLTFVHSISFLLLRRISPTQFIEDCC
jgi:hypothetical protein